nr:MAG: threonine synthase [Vulcanisaeta sp. AZ3]
MVKAYYKCPRCGFTAETSSWFWRCPRCGGVLDVIIEELRFTLSEHSGLWRFSSVIPVKPLVSLGEGSTPLIRAKFLGESTYLKLEYLNPTGSFKDRGSAVAVSRALEFGAKTVIEDSSGNAGISIAAYSSAAGIRAKVYVPKDAPESKKILIRSLGAELIEAPTRAEAAKMAMESIGEGEVYIGHSWNPWFLHGTKTLAYELFDQLGRIPRVIVLPASAGTLLLGLYIGFKELLSLGMIDELPRLYAIQAQGYARLYEELHGKSSKEPTRIADALRVSDPPRINQMVEAVRSSNGDSLVVNDNEIVSAWRDLLRNGLIVEPSSAVALSGYQRLLRDGLINKSEEVVIVLTGNGLKYIDLMGNFS